jgi:hypothetical protein
MRIAFVSHEYPPDTAFGGIATYVRQAATLLAGIHVIADNLSAHKSIALLAGPIVLWQHISTAADGLAPIFF